MNTFLRLVWLLLMPVALAQVNMVKLSFDDRASLLSHPVTAYQTNIIAETAGYSAIGDGGGSSFFYSGSLIPFNAISDSEFAGGSPWLMEHKPLTFLLSVGGTNYSAGAATMTLASGTNLTVTLAVDGGGEVTGITWVSGLFTRIIDRSSFRTIVQGTNTTGTARIFTYETSWTTSTGAGVNTPHATVMSIMQVAEYKLSTTNAVLSVTVSGRTAGTLDVAIDGTAIATLNANGATTYTYTPVAETEMLKFTPSTDFDGSIDNVSLIQRYGNTYVTPAASGGGYWISADAAAGRPLNVRMFGAKGVGTDDFVAFTNAVHTVGAMGGGTVFVPPGKYNLSDALYIFKDRTFIRGSGMDATFIQLTKDERDGIVWYLANVGGMSDLTVDNITDIAPSTEVHGVETMGSDYIVFDRVRVRNTDDGGFRIGYQSKRAGYPLDVIDYSNGSKYCRLNNCVVDGVVDGSGFEFFYSYGCVLQNCLALNVDEHAVRLAGASYTVIDGCQLIGYKGQGVYIGETAVGAQLATGNIVQNCLIDHSLNPNSSTASIYIQGITNAVVQNNTMLGAGNATTHYGIGFFPNANKTVSGVRILNNRFTGFTYGVNFHTSYDGISLNDSTIEGNTFNDLETPSDGSPLAIGVNLAQVKVAVQRLRLENNKVIEPDLADLSYGYYISSTNILCSAVIRGNTVVGTPINADMFVSDNYRTLENEDNTLATTTTLYEATNSVPARAYGMVAAMDSGNTKLVTLLRPVNLVTNSAEPEDWDSLAPISYQTFVDGEVMTVSNRTSGTTMGVRLTGLATIGESYTAKFWAAANEPDTFGNTVTQDNEVWSPNTTLSTTWTEYTASFRAISTNGFTFFKSTVNSPTDFLSISNFTWWVTTTIDGEQVLPTADDLWVYAHKPIAPSTRTVTVTAVGTSFDPTADVLVLDPNADHTMTSTPTVLPGYKTGQKLLLITSATESDSVIVQDNDTLAGTLLQLEETTRTISPGIPLELYWDGTYWNAVVSAADSIGAAGSGTPVWVNGTEYTSLDLDDSADADFNISGTNVTITLDPTILKEADASALYQATNAALTALAGNPQLYQATNSALTALAGNSQLYQATNANLTVLANTPTTYQATNANLTALASNPQLYQATNAALTALAGNANLYQATNATLTVIQAIGTGASGDVIIRNANSWTNLVKSTDGKVLKLASGLPSWQDDSTAAGGETAGTVHAPDGATTANRIATFKDTTGTNITQGAVGIADLQPADNDLLRLATITSASGDVLYRDATGWTNLAKSTDNKILKLTSGFPSWQDDATGSGATNIDYGSANTYLVTNLSALNLSVTGSGTGTLLLGDSDGNHYGGLIPNATTTTDTILELPAAPAAGLLVSTVANVTNMVLTAISQTTYQATNAALTALAGNSQLYQATNAALTALAGNANLYQATNANLTAALAGNANLYQATNTALTTLASGEAGGLTVAAAAGATNATQLVTLAQLQSASPGGQSSFFNLAASAAGYAAGYGGFTAGTTNINSLTAVSTVTTNTGAALVTGDYVAFFISTNTYASISDGLSVVSMWCFEASAGSPTIKAEVYLINSVTKQVEYEYEPSPAYQLVPATPTGLVFSVPVTARATGTNMYVAWGIKQGANGTVRLVTGGTNNSHANFPLPNSALVLKSGDTMTGLLDAAGGLAVGATNVVTALAGKAPNTFAGITNALNYFPLTNTLAAVTNALAFTGSTTTYLRSDGTQATPSVAGSGDAAYVNGTEVSDSFALTNTTASATVAGTTWSVSAAADPSPDRVSVAISDASATVSGVVTAQAQTFAGAKDFAGGLAVGATNVVTTIALKAPLAGPALTGDPTVPNIVLTDSDTTIANTAFVKSNITAYASATADFTNKTLDAAGTGNVLKQTRYIVLQRPDYTDGSGAVLVTNVLGSSGLMHCTFSGTARRT